MTVLEFVAALVGALAWPAAFVAVVLVLRRQILELFPRLRSLAFRDTLKAEFGEALEEAERAVEAVALPGPGEVPWAEQPPLSSGLRGVSIRIGMLMDPGAGVDMAWRDLRQDLRAALQEEGYTGRVNRTAIQEHLISTGRLPQTALEVLDKLEELRQKAVEEPEALDPQSAHRFVNLSDRLRRGLRTPTIEDPGAAL